MNEYITNQVEEFKEFAAMSQLRIQNRRKDMQNIIYGLDPFKAEEYFSDLMKKVLLDVQSIPTEVLQQGLETKAMEEDGTHGETCDQDTDKTSK